MKELDVLGYEGLYKVREDGQIRSLDRYNIDLNGKRKFYPGCVLSPTIHKRKHTSYKSVVLSKKGKTKKWSVHTVVGIAFVPNPDNKPHLNHIDNNGLNNHYTNIEWCTHSENMLHAQKQGRLFASQSKAGKVAGNIVKRKAQILSDAYLNTRINDWYIKSYDTTKKIKKYVIAECCLCKKEYSVYLSTITTEASKHCKSCGTKIKKEQKNIEQLKKLKQTVINDLLVIGTGNYRESDNRFVVDLQCTVCGKIKRQPLSLVVKKKISCNHTKCGRKKI